MVYDFGFRHEKCPKCGGNNFFEPKCATMELLEIRCFCGFSYLTRTGDFNRPTLREGIENIVSGYSDGTFRGLEHGHLIEYFSDGKKNPKTLVDEIMNFIEG